jgi:hypothetical protein
MSLEDFYIYMILHNYKHFVSMGIGVRAVMDIYFFNNKFGETLNFGIVDSILKSCGAKSFESDLRRLGSCWFDGSDDSKGLNALSNFILSNGTFGSYMNLVASDLTNGKKAAKLRYILKKIFPPFQGSVRLIQF